MEKATYASLARFDAIQVVSRRKERRTAGNRGHGEDVKGKIDKEDDDEEGGSLSRTPVLGRRLEEFEYDEV